MLTSLSLRDFRSYAKKTYSFSPTSTLIRGANTAGKTNVLEAIMLLSTGRSFRAKKESEMLHWGREVASVKGSLETGDGKTTLEVRITGGEVSGEKAPIKRYLVNDIARRQVDFAGNLKAVLFWPEDLELITDSPSLRRRYLDTVLIQTDREYRRNLLSYERGLRQRNKLLDLIRDGTANENQLLFWNQLLIRAGGYITEAREAYIGSVNGWQEKGARYRILYDKSVISDARLMQYAREEIAAGSTLVGPHRDDLIVYEEIGAGTEVELARYGSRGQQRLAVLWMKFAELSYVETATGTRPLLLLDDVFSELDPAHRKRVTGMIEQQQTIVTSADPTVDGELEGAIREIISL